MNDIHIRVKHLAIPVNLVALLSLMVFTLSTHAISYGEMGYMQANTINPSLTFIKKDYEFVLFYSTTCSHCIKFAPIVKQYADSTYIPVRAFMVGYGKSIYFPQSTLVNRETIEQFFGKNGLLALPTLFLLNKKNLHAYPVSQGALTYSELQIRMNSLIPKIMQNEEKRGSYNG